MEYISLQTFKSLSKQELFSVNESDIINSIAQTSQMLSLEQAEKSIIQLSIIKYLTPNMVFDEQATLNKTEVAEEIMAAPKFTTQIRESEPIIYKGEMVNSVHIHLLKELNLSGVKANFLKYIGILTYAIVLFILIERFLYFFTPNYHKDKITYIAFCNCNNCHFNCAIHYWNFPHTHLR